MVVPPLTGHVLPAVSIGAALREAGHEVTWAGHASVVGPLLPDGAPFVSLGEELPGEVARAVAERSRKMRGLESVQFLWQDVLVPLARAMRPRVEQLLGGRGGAGAGERFDVVVADQQAIGGALAARRAGVPWVTLCTTSAGVLEPLAAFPKVAAWVEGRLAELQEEAGVEVVEKADLSKRLVLVTSTRALMGEGVRLPEQVRLVGPATTGRREDVGFPWERLESGRRRVLVSLGTVNAERGGGGGGGLYRAAVEAVGDLGAQLVLVAPPDVVGEVREEDVIVQERVPQLALLKRVDVVVTHGGHNTVCEALAEGLPLVVAPIRDDQPVIAGQVVAAGAGVRVRFGGLSAPTLRAAVEKVLGEPGFREAAERVKVSFEAAGGAREAARLIERLVANGLV